MKALDRFSMLLDIVGAENGAAEGVVSIIDRFEKCDGMICE